MTVGGDDDRSDVEGDIVETAINIIRSEEMVAAKNRVFGFFHERASTVFSKVTSGKDDRRIEEFNLEMLQGEDREVKLVEKGPEISPFRSVDTEDGSVIELNLDAFEEADRERILSKILYTYEDQGRLLAHEQELEFKVIEEANHDARNTEILEHFGEFLSESQLRLLRRSLSIRTAWEMNDVYVSNDKINRWKRDLREKFGESANTVANFCSSGYYDRDGILREIMSDVAEQYDQESKIQDAYDQIVEDEPFVVYVGHMDDAWERSVALRNKLRTHDTYSYSVPFVDLRAQGYENRQIAKEAIETVREDLSKFEYRELHPDNELVYRIDTASIEGIDR